MPIIILDDLHSGDEDSAEKRAKLSYWYERLVKAHGIPTKVLGPMYPDHPLARFLMLPVGDETTMKGGKVDLREGLKEFARLRKLLEEINEERKRLEEIVAKTPEAQRVSLLKDSAKAVAGQKERMEHEVKEMAKALWRPGMPKEVLRGVKVRETRLVLYEPFDTVRWCQENAKAYLRTTIDHEAFSKAVLAGALPGAPAEIQETVEVLLDRDLSAYLEEPRQVAVGDEGQGDERQSA